MFDEPTSNDPAIDDHVDPPGSSTTTAGWSPPSLIVGITLVTIALSGMIDDSGLADHPWWVVPAACLFAACAAIGARTVQRLMIA